jgi:flagellar hook-associated protein 2
MGRITTSIGLITGFPIEETVNKLIALSAKPRDALQTRVDKLTVQQNLYTAISTALLKLQLASVKLTNANIFDTRTAFSGDQSLIRVSTSGSPAIGSYQFTPLRKAQSQQLLSSGFESNTSPLGAGQLKLRFGGAIDAGVSLETLNGGRGVAAGSIRITDRSGQSAVVDLRMARSVDDVVRSINASDGVNVRAEARGDRFVLVDQTGQTLSNLRVLEVSGGTTAADLGLAGIDVAANEAQGQDVVYLGRETLLSSLNNGNGVRFDSKLADVRLAFRDGSSPLDVEFTTAGVDGTKAMATTNSAAGLDGQLVFTALKPGSSYSGVQIRFEHDANITKGAETATFDATAKRLTFKIREGVTSAADIIASFGRSPSAAGAFTVRLADGSTGAGLIFSSDSGVTTGPPATATTPGTNGANAQLTFSAVYEGANYSGVRIRFVDDPSVTAGAETVSYDDSNPASKTLTFRIDAGHTTANDIVQAVASNAQIKQLFKVANANGSNGTGVIDAADEVVTSGGEIVEPVPAKTARTIGDVLDVLNAADPVRLRAQISADRESIELIDLTSGANAFSAQDINGSRAAHDLGLDPDAAGNTITGRRVLAGLNTSLLSSLNGGAGLGQLGALHLTDRSGTSATVDLTNARTIQDVLSAINAAGLGLTASVNAARNGITISDTTGQATSNLIVASGDGHQTAEKLGIVFNSAANTINSGSLNRQVVGENTLLSSLNGGAGISSGRFTIYGTASASGTIDLSTGEIRSVGELISAINGLNIGVSARINQVGDGVELIDMLGASGTMRVEDQSGTAAKELRLTGAASERVVDGITRKVINGSTTYTIDITATDTLESLVDKLNAAGGGFSAAQFNAGGGATPYKLAISSQRSGAAGNLIFDTSGLSFTLQETIRGEDALVLFGNASGGTIAASSTNDFKNLLPGVNLQLVGTSANAVDVTVNSSGQAAVDAIKVLVESYNTVRKQLADATNLTPSSDSQSVTTGPLFGETSVLRIDTDLARVFSQRVVQAGSIQSLATVGLSLNRDGTLVFDEAKFNAELAANPQGVKDFFTTPKSGFVARLRSTIDQLSGGENSVLVRRLEAISSTVESQTVKIADWNQRLEKQKNQLLIKFYRMEEAIGKMQNDLAAVTNLQQTALAFMSASSQKR